MFHSRDYMEIFIFGELVDKKWGALILSNETFLRLKNFESRWRTFVHNKAYGQDGVFVYFDPEWRNIVLDYLIDSLKYMEGDFEEQSIQYIGVKTHFDPSAHPTTEEILNKGEVLYNILLQNGLQEKEWIL